MGRALVALTLLAACSQDSDPGKPATEPQPTARAADAAPPPWWQTAAPCPDGAALDRSEPSRLACRRPDGTAHGRFVELRDDGSPRLEGRYIDGKRDGTFTRYNPAGETIDTLTFERGTGRWVGYNDDGTIAVEGPYRDDRRAGDWRWRWTVGTDAGATKLEYIATYRDGAVVSTALFRAGVAIPANDKAAPAIELPKGAPPHRVAGVLGALLRQQEGAFASLTGTADFSSGLEDADVYGGLLGNEVGEMQGGWGYGLRGTGPGGEASGWGTIGTGRYGTIGRGGGGGQGYGVRGRRGRRSVTSVRLGKVVSIGGLDKNIIRRYIRRKLPRIRHCYEKQLLVKPRLKGTVTVEFTIAPTGAVSTARAKGVDKAVADCLQATVRSIQFPKPKSGGAVKVRYPFMFRPA